jgi:hypothetical protein
MPLNMIKDSRVGNAGKCHYRADGRGVRGHVSSTVEALIANTTEVMVGSHDVTREITINSGHIFVVLIKRENSIAGKLAAR